MQVSLRIFKNKCSQCILMSILWQLSMKILSNSVIKRQIMNTIFFISFIHKKTFDPPKPVNLKSIVEQVQYS